MNLVQSSRKTKYPEILDQEHRELQEFYSEKLNLHPPQDWLPDNVLYGRLQTTRTSTTSEIYTIYKKLSRSVHPDKINRHLNRGDREKTDREQNDHLLFATREFQRIQKAWEVISDPISRKVYDMFGLQGLQHKTALLKNAVFKDSENPEFYELIIAAGLFNIKLMNDEQTAGLMIDITQKISLTDAIESKIIEYRDEKDEVTRTEIPNFVDRVSFTKFETFRMNVGMQPVYQDPTKAYRFNFVLMNGQAVYAFNGKHNINNNHDLEGRVNIISGANSNSRSIAETSAIYTYKSGGSSYPWSFTSEIPVMMNLEENETLDSTIIKPTYSSPIFKLVLPLIKPNAGRQVKLNTSIEVNLAKITAESLKISFDYTENVENGKTRTNEPTGLEKWSIQSYKISPFVKWTKMGLRVGSEANINFKNGISIEIEAESESKAQFLKYKGKNQMVLHEPANSGQILCNLPLGKAGVFKFGLKMDSSESKMNKNGSVSSKNSSIRLLVGVQLMQIGLTIPLELPNEAVYVMTGLAVAGGLGFSLRRWLMSEDKEDDDDDVLAEKENKELKKLTKKYRDMFDQKSKKS